MRRIIFGILGGLWLVVVVVLWFPVAIGQPITDTNYALTEIRFGKLQGKPVCSMRVIDNHGRRLLLRPVPEFCEAQKAEIKKLRKAGRKYIRENPEKLK